MRQGKGRIWIWYIIKSFADWNIEHRIVIYQKILYTKEKEYSGFFVGNIMVFKTGGT